MAHFNRALDRRKTRRTAVAALAALLCAMSLLAQAEPTAPWFVQLMAQFAAIPERHETFREEKRLSVLNLPLLSEGELTYRRPSYLEKVTITPRQEILLVNGDQLTLTGPDGSPRELLLSSRPEIGVLVDAVGGTLSGDLTRLERSYTVEASGDAQAWQIVLLPTGRRVREMLRQIVIRGSGTTIRTMLTEQANGDTQLLTVDAPRQDRMPAPHALSGAAFGNERSADFAPPRSPYQQRPTQPGSTP